MHGRDLKDRRELGLLAGQVERLLAMVLHGAAIADHKFGAQASGRGRVEGIARRVGL